jgi:hypothetical protein
VFQILKLVLFIAAMLWLFRQVRKPSGSLGRRILHGMNLGQRGARSEVDALIQKVLFESVLFLSVDVSVLERRTWP